MAVVLFLGESRKLQIIWAKSVNAVLYHTFDEKGNNSVCSLKHTWWYIFNSTSVQNAHYLPVLLLITTGIDTHTPIGAYHYQNVDSVTELW